MTLWDLAAQHPWWTLVYLGILCGTVGFVAYWAGDLITVNSGMNSGQFHEHNHEWSGEREES